jgi:hypothetical protein
MTFLVGDVLDRVREAIGKEPPAENSIRGLDDLPKSITDDLEKIYQEWGAICAFAYLHHVSDAKFGDVKLYISDKGWGSSVD